jgi:HD-like signal output (HDOD) protein
MTTSDKIPSSIFRKQAPKKILRSELNVLLEMLRTTDFSLTKFGQEVSRYPVVFKQILRAANSSLTGSAVEISEVAHATLFLGSRRVEYLLSTLPSEIIEEDAEADETAV